MDMDLNSALDHADFATRQVPICLKGSLREEWEQAELAAANAHDALIAARSEHRPTAPLAVAEQEALEAFDDVDRRIQEASVTFTLTAVPEDVWRATKLKHPPREGYVLDQMAGFDKDAGGPDMVRLCLVDPVPDDATWARLLTKLNPAQFNRLLTTVAQLNEKDDGTIPFSYAVSEVIRSSGEKSSAPEPSESASESSGEAQPDGTSSPAT
jgi:hypothetical protein